MLVKRWEIRYNGNEPSMHPNAIPRLDHRTDKPAISLIAVQEETDALDETFSIKTEGRDAPSHRELMIGRATKGV